MLIMRFLFLFIIVALLGFNNVSHSQNPDKTKSDDSNKGKKKKGDEKINGKIKTVVVEGVGDSSENAVKDAQRNAVNQVVGVLIDAKVMIKNDKLIEDKILTLSNGFVKTSKVISQNKSGKLFKVKVEAVVEVTGIENILKKEKLMVTVETDGDSLVNQEKGKEKITKDASEMIKKKMKDFPGNVLEIQVNEKATKVLKTVGNVSTLQYEILIKPNLEKYKNFSKSLEQILDKITSKTTEGVLNFEYSSRSKTNELNSREFVDRYNPVYYYAKNINSSFLNEINKDSFILGISTNRTSGGRSLNYKLYILDIKYLAPFLFNIKNSFNKSVLPNNSGQMTLSDTICLKVRLLDKNNQEIILKKYSVPSLFSHGKGRSEILFINNVFFNKKDVVNDNIGQNPELYFRPTIDIETEDLKKVKKIEVTIE